MKVLFPLLSLFVFLDGTTVLGKQEDRHGGNERVGPQSYVLLEDIKLPHINRVLFPHEATKRPNQKQRKTQVELGKFSKLAIPTVNKYALFDDNEAPDTTVDTGDIKPPINYATVDHSDSDYQNITKPPNTTVPMDPNITKGVLANGLTYYVMPNKEPPGQLELMLHIDAGANFELEEEQRGLAHFMEHMMFQTTANFPEPGSLIPALQRLGIQFGRHLNAYTTLDETAYSLSLPNTESATVTTAMTWMKDILGGALLEEEEIDMERGVVVSELQVRDNPSLRIFKEILAWLLPDSIISKRFVSGTEETINNMNRDQFVQFYNQYYIPRRATFIAVGDVDVTELVSRIEETFGDLPDSGDRGPEPDYGTAPEGFGLRTKVFYDAAANPAQISLTSIRPTEVFADTELARYQSLNQVIANIILSNRLDRADFISTGGADSSSLHSAFDMHSVTVLASGSRWTAVEVLEQEIRRAMIYGFAEFEVEEVKSQILNFFEQEVLGKASRDSADLAETINAAINGGFVVSTPEENLRIAAAALDATTPYSVQAAFQSIWNATDLSLYMVTNSITGSEEEMASALEGIFLDSQQVEVENVIVAEETVFWAYTDFGPPGSVVSRSYVEDLDIQQYVLSNNVRVNMKKTDFDAGLVFFQGTFGTGMIGQRKDATFLDKFAEFVLNVGGLGEHDIADLERIVSGKTISVEFAITEGDFKVSGGANRDDLELALQILTAYFVDPGFRPEASFMFRSQISSVLGAVNSVGGTYQFKLLPWLLGGDERFVAPDGDELRSYKTSDARDWLMPHLESSYLEFTIVGDFDEEATLDLLLETVGALPERESAPEEIPEEARAINVPAPAAMNFTYDSSTPQAGAWLVWEVPSFVSRDVAFSRQMNVLSGIVRDRMRIKIREELGGSYSPDAGPLLSRSFDYGFLIAWAEGAPEVVGTFIDILLEIAADLSAGGITQDEFDRALFPLQSSLDDTLRDNSYWIQVLDTSQANPDQLDWSRGRDLFYDNLTLAEIQTLAREYLTVDRAFPLSILPVDNDGVVLGSTSVATSRLEETTPPIVNAKPLSQELVSNGTATTAPSKSPCDPLLVNSSTSVLKSGPEALVPAGCEEEEEHSAGDVESSDVSNAAESTETTAPTTDSTVIPVLPSSAAGSSCCFWAHYVVYMGFIGLVL